MRLRWSPMPPTLGAVQTLQPHFPQRGVGGEDGPSPWLTLLPWAPAETSLHSECLCQPVLPHCTQPGSFPGSESSSRLPTRAPLAPAGGGQGPCFMGAQGLLGGFLCLWLQIAPVQSQWPFPGTWHLQTTKTFGDRSSFVPIGHWSVLK